MQVRLNRIALLRSDRNGEKKDPGQYLNHGQQWAGVGKRLTYWTVGGVVLDRNRIGVNRLARDSRGYAARNLFDLRGDGPEIRTGMDVSLDDEKLYSKRKKSNRKQ